MTLSHESPLVAHGGAPFPVRPEEVTPEWLTSVLHTSGALVRPARITNVHFDSLSEGVGMMGTVSRLHVQYDGGTPGPASLILKSASSSPASIEVAQRFRLYEREVNFYLSLGPALEPEVPHAYYAVYHAPTVDYAILMEDFVGYRTGNQVLGADVDQARRAVSALARFHAKYWDRVDDAALSWVPSNNSALVRDQIIAGCHAGWDTMVRLFAAALPAEVQAAKNDYLSRLPAMYTAMATGPQTLAHTDYRADNLLFGDAPAHQPIVVLDWSAVAKTKGVQDLAYFTTQNLSDGCRANHEAELQELYYRTLLEEGVEGYGPEAFERDYELAVLFNFVYAIVIASSLDLSNERATAFVGKLASRSAECIVERDLLRTVLLTLSAG